MDRDIENYGSNNVCNSYNSSIFLFKITNNLKESKVLIHKSFSPNRVQNNLMTNIKSINNDLIESKILGKSLERSIYYGNEMHSSSPQSELEVKCSPRLPYGKLYFKKLL